MNSSKRIPRSYKIENKYYLKAMRRAKKEKAHLATMIEEVVFAYGEGAYSISFKTKKQTT